MNYVKLLFVLFVGLTASGCASGGARTDYYLAVQQTAAAQAAQSEARYRALATIANSGDSAAKAMATMAIAMNQDETIAPAYIESDALSWARVLATPVATLGGLWIQSDVAKNASNNAKEIQMASFASNEAIQLGQQNMVTGLGQSWATTAAGSADIAVAGFNALNTAGDQTVTLGVAGLNTADSIAGAGFDANATIAGDGFDATTTVATAGLDAATTVAGLGFATADSIATTGFTTVDSVATTGFTTVDSVATTGMEGMATLGLAGMTGIENVGIAGLTNLNEVSQYGMTTIGAVATTGMTNMTTISGAGMDGIQAMGTAGMTNLTTLGTTGIDAVSTVGTAGIDAVGTVGTSGMNLLDAQGTNYTSIIADMQATIDQLGADLADPITCSPNADGLYVCQ